MKVDCEDLFREVIKTYFPRWKNASLWDLKFDEDLPNLAIGPCVGLCIKSDRLICISSSHVERISGEELEALIIHECTHAVTNCFHGKTFLKRMEKASDKATRLGKNGISEILCNEVRGYRDQPARGFCTTLYESIEEDVLENVEVNLQSIINGYAFEYITSVEDIMERCTRCEFFFRKAKRRVQLENRLQKKIEEAIDCR